MTNWTVPFANLTNATNITGVAKYVNEVTDGVFWLGIFFAVWIIMFVSLIKFGERQAFITSSFVTAIVSYLLAAMQLINAGYVVIPTALTVFGVMLLIKKGD